MGVLMMLTFTVMFLIPKPLQDPRGSRMIEWSNLKPFCCGKFKIILARCFVYLCWMPLASVCAELSTASPYKE